MNEEKQELIAKIRFCLNAIEATEPDTLVHADLDSSVNLADSLDEIIEVQRLFNQLHKCDLSRLPVPVLRSLSMYANGTIDLFKRCVAYSLDIPEPANVRQQIIASIQNIHNACFTLISQILVVSDLATAKDYKQRNAGALNAIMSAQQAEMSRKLQVANSIVEQMRTAANRVGIAQQAIFFETEAETHNKHARFWLFTALVVAIATVAIALFLFQHGPTIPPNASAAYIVHVSLERVAILSLLSYILVWCIRNFAASRHNFVINRQRHNALSVVEPMINNAQDKVSEAILLKATEAVFDSHTSGFLKNTEDRPSVAQIEFMRDLVHELTDKK